MARSASDPLAELRHSLGDVDVYLLDQILKGRIRPNTRLLDAGCGAGRNVAFLMSAGVDVHGVDRSADAITAIRRLASERAPRIPAAHFIEAPVEAMPLADAYFDVVLAIAVLHFAADDGHFDRTLGELWRVLAPGGMLFTRLASSIGLPADVAPGGTGRARLPDGSERYLVDEAMLLDRTAALGATLLEPIKTVNVQGLRCMTTWVLRKPAHD